MYFSTLVLGAYPNKNKKSTYPKKNQKPTSFYSIYSIGKTHTKNSNGSSGVCFLLDRGILYPSRTRTQKWRFGSDDFPFQMAVFFTFQPLIFRGCFTDQERFQQEFTPRKWKLMNNWVVVSNIFYFHPYLWKWSNLTNIFQMGWNHQLEKDLVAKAKRLPWQLVWCRLEFIGQL